MVWALAALCQSPLGEHLVFKGGTSLSKAYGVIRRFSEDVDLTYDIRTIAPDLVGPNGETLPKTRSEEKRWSNEVHRRLPDWVVGTPQRRPRSRPRGGTAQEHVLRRESRRSQSYRLRGRDRRGLAPLFPLATPRKLWSKTMPVWSRTAYCWTMPRSSGCSWRDAPISRRGPTGRSHKRERCRSRTGIADARAASTGHARNSSR